MQSRKPSIRILPRIDRDRNASKPKLVDHRIELAHTKIDHPLFSGVSEVIAVCWERSKNGGPCFLRPRLLAVIRWCEINAEVLSIPLSQRRRILRSEKHAAYS